MAKQFLYWVWRPKSVKITQESELILVPEREFLTEIKTTNLEGLVLSSITIPHHKRCNTSKQLVRTLEEYSATYIKFENYK